jgi:hypothetical protein
MSISVVNVYGKVNVDKSTVPVRVEEDFADAPDIESLVNGSETKDAVGVRPVTDFKTKVLLETYGKEFGIDLDKTKTIKNMYKDLTDFINR